MIITNHGLGNFNNFPAAGEAWGKRLEYGFSLRNFHEWLRNALLRLHNLFVQTQFLERGERPKTRDIANFKKVSSYFFAGSQPTAEGYGWLLQRRFKSIVTFREEDPRDIESRNYPQFDHLQILVNDRDIPTFEQVEEFLRFVDDPGNSPVFAHCRGGTGRTKTMIACWQVAHGRPAYEAVQEALASGIRFSLSLSINVTLSVIFSINEKQQSFIFDFEKYRLSKSRFLT